MRRGEAIGRWGRYMLQGMRWLEGFNENEEMAR